MPENRLERLEVGSNGEVADLIRRATSDGGAVIVQLDGAEYAVHVTDIGLPVRLAHRLRASDEEREALWKDYDAERVRVALRQTAGSWSDIDTDELVANVYRWKEAGSRPANHS